MLLAACGRGVGVEAEEPVPAVEAVREKTTRDRLSSDGLNLEVAPFDSLGTVQVRRTWLDGSPLNVPLKAHQGRVELRLVSGDNGDELEVSALDIQLEEIHFTAEEVPPHGMGLSQVRLLADAPMRAPITWLSADTEGFASWVGAFRIKGMLLTPSGYESPFDEQQLNEVPVSLALSADARGKLIARFRCERSGVLWSGVGLVDSGTFEFAGRALETSLPDQAR